MKVCFILGTRPEAIKLFPLVREFVKRNHQVTIFDTCQQKGAILEFLNQFVVGVDYKSFSVPVIDGTISGQLASQIREVEVELTTCLFDLCVVHGDTNTTLIGALAAFYSKTPLIHIEAGLRSGDVVRPFPEEMNRRLVSRLARFHAAPTENCKANLLTEGCVEQDIVVCGNTVIDALMAIRALPVSGLNRIIDTSVMGLKVLVACHRRENRNHALSSLCREIKKNQDMAIHFWIMLHPNPVVSDLYRVNLKNVKNVTFVDPLGYKDFINLLDYVDGVITDSGGIQEEVAYLNKPTLIFRSETERLEVLNIPNIQLSINFPKDSVLQLKSIINSSTKGKSNNLIFGNGDASSRILDYIECRF